MKSKFITVEGYGEIQSLKKVQKAKKQPVCKRIKKFGRISCILISQGIEQLKQNRAKSKRLETCYRSQRRNGSQMQVASAVTLSRAKKADKNTARHLRKTSKSAGHFLRNKAVLGAATSFVAAVLCVMTSMSVISFDALAYDSAEEAVAVHSGAQEVSVNDSEITKVVHSNISKSMSRDEVLTFGYGLYIDNELAGVSVDKSSLEAALQNRLDEYKAKYDDETTDMFANDVDIVAGSYSPADFDEAESIVEKNSDKFSYSLSTDIIYTQRVPYATEIKYDSSQPDTYKKVIQKGINGKEKVTLRVTYVDSVQTDARTTGIKTTKEAQKKIVTVGTKKTVAASPSVISYSTSAASSGTGFMWPLPYTRNITSGYGPRWGSMHTGIDIAAGGVYGQPIAASDSGVVIWAGGDSSGYGNYVIIDHGNGYQTLYGHCSSLNVSRGQSVSKGQTIAFVGSTGNSTGPHLHFEIRSGGSRLNPLNFV